VCDGWAAVIARLRATLCPNGRSGRYR
jgi:hypothetical protein